MFVTGIWMYDKRVVAFRPKCIFGNDNIIIVDMHTRDTTTPLLLILYEFEARAKLGDPNLEDVLEKALSLSYTEPKAFETIAGKHTNFQCLCWGSPAHGEPALHVSAT